MDDPWIAWAAGFFDGDGSVHLAWPAKITRGVAPFVRLTVTQARREPLDHFRAIVGIGDVFPRGDGYFHWVTAQNRARAVLLRLRPHLVTRYQRAEELCRWEAPIASASQWDAWLAGLVDAEGCLQLAHVHHARGYGLYLDLKMADWTTIQHAIWVAGWGQPLSYVRPQRQRQYCIRWSTNHTLSLLKRLRPYLVVKAAEADVALQYEALRGHQGIAWTPELIEARETLRAELQSLKYRNRGQEKR